MKNIFFIVGLLLATPVFAVQATNNAPYTVDIDLSMNNLASTYNISFPQLVLTDLLYVKRLTLINSSAAPICCNTVTLSKVVAPSVGDNHELCVPSMSFLSYDNINIQSNIYCRGEVGAVAAGTLRVQTW